VTNIRRYQTTGRPVFITAVCYRRKPYLETDWQKELLLAVMREVKPSSGFAMHAYVILDDHFHWIITPGGQNFSAIMQSIKLRFVHRYKKAIGKKEQATLWQRRFWDHVIRNSEDLHRHMDYIHYNPVKHGYVSKPSGYRWSSFNTHMRMGNYAANWGTDTISETIHTMNLE
jgi:putative transposase